MKIKEIFTSLDRRIIYLLLLFAVIIPFLFNVEESPKTLPDTKNVFDFIEDTLTNNGKALLISVDYDPQAEPELTPMLESLIRHALYKKIPLMLMALYPQGVGLALRSVEHVKKEYNAAYGRDYVLLGWAPGGPMVVILGLGDSIGKVFKTDYYGNLVDTLPMMKNHFIKNLKQVGLAISLTAGSAYGAWIVYAHSGFNTPIATGVTGVVGTQIYPYLQSRQLVGGLIGLRSGAEYERILKEKGYSKTKFRPASRGMASQTFAHILFFIFIAMANIGLIIKRREK